MVAWEKDGLTTTEHALISIISDFRKHGTQDQKSTWFLTEYMSKLPEEKLHAMYIIDPEATLEILYNCFGLREAYEKYRKIPEETTDHHKAEEMKHRLDQERSDHAQTNKKLKKANETIDKLDDENIRLKNQIITLKAKLYDAFEAGFSPEDIYTPDTI